MIYYFSKIIKKIQDFQMRKIKKNFEKRDTINNIVYYFIKRRWYIKYKKIILQIDFIINKIQ